MEVSQGPGAGYDSHSGVTNEFEDIGDGFYPAWAHTTCTAMGLTRFTTRIDNEQVADVCSFRFETKATGY